MRIVPTSGHDVIRSYEHMTNDATAPLRSSGVYMHYNNSYRVADDHATRFFYCDYIENML